MKTKKVEASNAQLRILNPLLVQPSRRASVPLCFPLGGILAPELEVCGVTAFGMSGIIGGLILRAGRSDLAFNSVDELVFSHQTFYWQEPLHALAQHRLPSVGDGASTFRSLANGALHAIVADHVVQV